MSETTPGTGISLQRAKVCVLTSVHSPSDVRVFQKEAVALAETGYEVHLVAPSKQDSTQRGVRIHAVRQFNGRHSRMTRTTLEVYRRARSLKADVYHFHDPELIPFGILLKLAGKRVIYDVHEDVPKDILDKDWIAPWLRRPLANVMAAIEWVAARYLDRVIAATPSIARRFPKQKTAVVQNFPLQESLWSSMAIPYSDRPPIVTYIGWIGIVRGAREMISAMSMVPASLAARLYIAGEWYPPEFAREAATLPGWPRVNYLGLLSRDGVRDLLAKSRHGRLLFHPLANHVEAQPNNLYEYMSAALPVITSNFPLWKQIVEDFKCGLTVDPLDPEAIASAINWLLEHPVEAKAMGERGREAVLKYYNWEQEAQVLKSTYRDVLGAN